jgi:predicted RNA methylase
MLTLKSLFDMTPLELAAEGLRRKLYPFSMAADLRIAIAVDAVAKSEASPHLIWCARAPSFTRVMQNAATLEQTAIALSPREEIASALVRIAELTRALTTDEKRAADIKKAAALIAVYSGDWEGGFAADEPATSPLRSLLVKGVVKDILTTGSSSALQKLEAKRPADLSEAIKGLIGAVPGLSKERASELANAGFLTVEDLEARAAPAGELTRPEQLLVAYRSSFTQSVPNEELSEWSEKFTTDVFGSLPEDPQSETIQASVRWVIALAENASIIRVLFLADPKVYVGSGILAPTFKKIEAALGPSVKGILHPSTNFDDGGSGAFEVIVVKLSQKHPARRLVLMSVDALDEWPYRAASTLYAGERIAELASVAKSRNLILTTYGLFAKGTNEFLPAAGGTISGVFQIAASAPAPKEDDVRSPTSLVVIPISDMTQAGVEALSRIGARPEVSDSASRRSLFNAFQTESIEYEIRFNNVTGSMFFALLEHLRESVKRVTYEESAVSYYRGDIREVETSDSKTVFVEKKTILQSENEATGIRASVAIEKVLRRPKAVGRRTTVRERRRWSAGLGDVRVDASIVTTYFPAQDGGLKYGFSAYEVELEVGDVALLAALNKTTVRILHHLYSTPHIFSMHQRNKIFTECNRLTRATPDAYSLARTFPANVAALQRNPGLKLEVLARGVAASARNLKRRDLTKDGLGSGYTVSAKANGLTRYMLVSEDGVWILFPPAHAELVLPASSLKADKLESLKGLIMLGEEIPKQNRLAFGGAITVFSPFDILASPSPYEITPETPNYLRRLAAIKDYSEMLRDAILPACKDDLIISNKLILPVGDSRASLAAAFATIKKEERHFTTDGYMFTPIGTSQNPAAGGIPIPLEKRTLATTPDVCKYKPWKELSIDFAVNFEQRKVQVIGRGGRNIDFVAKFPRGSFNPKRHIDFDNKFFDRPEHRFPGVIVEFAPELLTTDPSVPFIESFKFVPQRARFDKVSPNGESVARDVFEDVIDPIDEDTLLGKNFNILRLHTNSVKRGLFQKALFRPEKKKTVVVDLGSGRGGDLSKFSSAVAFVLVEPNKDNVSELRARADALGILPKCHILHTAAQDSHTIIAAVAEAVERTGAEQIIVSMMLSLSFFFGESGKDFQALADTLSGVDRLTEIPTKFIFFTIEGSLVKEAFEEHGPNIKFGPATLKLLSDDQMWVNIDGTIVDSYTENFVSLQKLSEIVLIDAIVPALEGAKQPGSSPDYFTDAERNYGSLFVYGEGRIRSQKTLRKTILPAIDPADYFPYKRYFFPALETMFSELVIDLSSFPKNLVTRKAPKDGSPILVRTFPGDSERCDGMSNLFCEHIRVDCRFGNSLTPREAWHSLISDRSDILSKTTARQREEVYQRAMRECNTFNPTFASFIIQTYLTVQAREKRGLRILDPSAGWGDRLIGALATDTAGIKIESYVGVDPNPRMTDIYRTIASTLNRKVNVDIIPLPFEDAQVETDHFDVAITSPPFFSLEVYLTADDDKTKMQSTTRYSTYDSWKSGMYIPYIRKMFEAVRSGGRLVLYVSNTTLPSRELIPLADDTKAIVESFGASFIGKCAILIAPDSAESAAIMRQTSNKEKYAYIWEKP